MLGKSSDTFLEHGHVVRKVLKSDAAFLAVLKAENEALFSFLEAPDVNTISDNNGKDDHNERSQHSKTLRVLLEHGRDSKEKERKEHKHNKDVREWETAPEASGLSKLASGMKRDGTHEWNRVPDQDTGNVEHQVSKSNTKLLLGGSYESGHNSSHGGSNVGTKSQREHLFKTKHTHTNEGGKSGGSDRRGLDNHSNTSTNGNTKISVHVSGLVNNASRHAEEHLLEDGNKTNKTDEDHNDTNEEAHTTRDLIIACRSIALEESGAAQVAVALDDTGLARQIVIRIVTFDGIKATTIRAAVRSSILLKLIVGDVRSDGLVLDNDHLSKRLDVLANGSLPSLAVFRISVLGHGLGQMIEVSSDDLQRHKNSNTEEIEHVVARGSSESTLKLVGVTHLSDGNNSVGDRSTNVGSHDHVDTLAHREDRVVTNKRHNDRGGRGGGLEEYGGKDTNHQSCNRVGVVSEKRSGLAGRHNLGTGSEDIKTQKEKVEESSNSEKAEADPSPLGGGVAAAGLVDLLPGSVSVVFRDFEVRISEMDGSSGAILAGVDLLFGVNDGLIFFGGLNEV